MLSLMRRNRGFSIFLATQGLSNLGDAVRNVVVPLYLLQITHAPALVAALALLEVAPVVALQLPAGVLIDRWDRRRILLLVDLGRGAITLLIPATALAHGPVVAVLFATAVPLGALQCLFSAGFGAVTPSVVDRERVERAYALTEGVESLAWVAGPAVAGVLAATVGGATALAVDGASFLVSALGLAAIRLAPVERTAEPAALWRDLVDGVRFLWRTPPLRRVVTTWTLYMGAGSGVVLGLVAAGSRNGSGGVALPAGAVATYAAGSALGTVLAGWRRPPSATAAIAGCLAAIAAGSLLVAAGPAPAVVLGALAFGAGEGAFLVVYLTERAERTPDELMGRITSACGLLTTLSGAAGTAWMGLALQWLGGRAAFGLLAGLAAALASWVVVTAPRTGQRANP